MTRIIICDDNKTWLEKASGILKKHINQSGMDAELAECSSPDDIPGCFDAAPNVLFIDIKFDGQSVNGIDAVREINLKYPDCQVVYLTNYLGYALDVYRTQHIWFVTKDQFEDRLPEIFEKLNRIYTDSNAELIVKETAGARTKVMCRNIRYLERRSRATIIFTDEREYTVRERIPDIEAKLPAYFGRCHTSFIVNLTRVSTIGSKSLLLDDGTEILISRGYGRSFRLKYMEWAGSRTVR